MNTQPAPPPVPLRECGINDFHEVTPANYAQLCALYGASEVLVPPAELLAAGAALRGGQQAVLALPDGYLARALVVTSLTQPAPPVMVGAQVLATVGPAPVPMGNEPGPVPVSVGGEDRAMVHVQISCEPSGGTMDSWRIAIYQALVQGYERQLAAWRAQPQSQPAEPLPGGPS